MPGGWERFYAQQARRYAELSQAYLGSGFSSDNPALRGTRDLLTRLLELSPGPRGLDAGCGAGAVAMAFCRDQGCRMYGLDAVQRNLILSRDMHPALAGRILVHDLREPLPFADRAFDFVMCNAVIQHLAHREVFERVFPEFVRVLAGQGVLQLMFKPGQGRIKVYDRGYGREREFNLFPEDEVVQTLEGLGLELVRGDADNLGGLIRYTDRKEVLHCVVYLRRIN